MASPENYIARCSSCGAKNRIPADRIDKYPKCGKCGASINIHGLDSKAPIAVTDGNFPDIVLKASVPVLLDCWAPWCGPCRMVGPVIDDLAGEWRGRVLVAKLNVDENPGVAAKFSVQSIPTMLVFENGQLKDRMVGALPKSEIIKRVSPFMFQR